MEVLKYKEIRPADVGEDMGKMHLRESWLNIVIQWKNFND